MSKFPTFSLFRGVVVDNETGEIVYKSEVTSQITRSVYWTEPGLKITRLRLLTDRGFPMYDVSYCTGVLPSGEIVDVTLPFQQLNKKSASADIVKYAKEDKFFAAPTGIFSSISILFG